MGIDSRVAALEARRRDRGGGDEPLTFLRADYDADGRVIACEGMTVPLKLDAASVATLGPWQAGLAAMVRQPNSRATCPYADDCGKATTCRADGSLTRQQSNSPTVDP